MTENSTEEWMTSAPILKTLCVCPEASRLEARVELFWTLGFALLAVPIVVVIVLLSRPLDDMPAEVFAVVGRGELMIYAAAVCGVALYTLRHGIAGPLPDALKHRVTPLGTLSTSIGACLFIAITSYVVRRMGDIHHIPLNDMLLNGISVLILVLSLILTYVVLALKFALSSGAAPASHEQTAQFSQQWEAERGA